MRTRAIIGAVLALAFCAAPASAVPPFGQLWTVSPGLDSPGVNTPVCGSTLGHPSPVVLVHGTWGDRTVSWNLIAQKLIRDGYCVWALDYGNRATGRIADSAQQLKVFVDDVLRQTGASRVSIVGHSQGGMLPRWYMKNLGGVSKVDDLIGLAPSNHGTDNSFGEYAAEWGDTPAAADQAADSTFIKELNAGDESLQPDPEAFPGLRVSYTNVATRYDQVVTPSPTSQFLAGGADEVTNVLLQDKCAGDVADHIGIIYDAVALQWVESALSRPGPADPAFAPVCA